MQPKPKKQVGEMGYPSQEKEFSAAMQKEWLSRKPGAPGKLASMKKEVVKKKFNINQKQITPQTGRKEMAEKANGPSRESEFKVSGALSGLTGQYDKETKFKALAEKEKYKGKPGYDKDGNPLKTPFFKQGENMATTGYKK